MIFSKNYLDINMRFLLVWLGKTDELWSPCDSSLFYGAEQYWNSSKAVTFTDVFLWLNSIVSKI